MTTSRKPPLPPKPKLTRAPAKQQPEPKNPITQEIMQRVRRVILNSEGQITTSTIAEELGICRASIREWVNCSRSMPGADNLISLLRWLADHDNGLVITEVIAPKKIRFRGEVAKIYKAGRPHHSINGDAGAAQ